MCGRFFILNSPTDIADLFGLADVAHVATRYNIAPSQPVLAVGADRAGLPAVASFRWGMVPSWANDTKLAPINARSETAADKPMFAEAFRKRRCLIPASGFYEWVRRDVAVLIV
jgi:putative SOS response-associated peptidase YedK